MKLNRYRLGSRQRYLLRAVADSHVWVQHLGQGRMMLHVHGGVMPMEVLHSLQDRGLVDVEDHAAGRSVVLTESGRMTLLAITPT